MRFSSLYKSHKWRKTKLAIIGLGVVVIGLRLFLPWMVKNYLNEQLQKIPGYYGAIEDVQISLWRGAYQIVGMRLMKVNGNAREPFFKVNVADISVDWRALLQGRIVTSIELDHPALQFVRRATEASSQTSIDDSWQNVVRHLYPFELNRFLVKDGVTRYRDLTSEPKIDFYFRRLHLRAENISNTDRNADILPSTLEMQARFLGSGQAELMASFSVLTEPTEFFLKARIQHLDLREINSFAKAYGNFDFDGGEFEATAEYAATKTAVDGYVKTLFKKVSILDWSREHQLHDSLGHFIWESVVAAIIDIFKNGKRDQFAARIPFHGARKDIQSSTWETVGSILKNAFVQALSPKFEDSVQFSKLKVKAK